MILQQLEETAIKLYADYPEEEYTEEFVEEKGKEYMGRDLDNIEKLVILSKLQNEKEQVREV